MSNSAPIAAKYTAGLPLKLAGGLPARRELTAAAAPQSPLAAQLSTGMSRYLRPQAAYRWLLPSLAAITPQYIEQTLRGALAGNHVQAWELFDLMLDTWPELASCTQELTEAVCRRKVIWSANCDDDETPSDDATQRLKVVQTALRRMRPQADADENDLQGTIKDLMSAWFMGQTVLEVNWDRAYGSDELNILNTAKLGDITAPRSTFWVHPVCYAWNMDGRLGLRQELGQVRDATKSAIGNAPGLWNSTSYQPRPADILEFPAEKFLVAVSKGKSGTALGGARLRCLAQVWCWFNFCGDWTLNLAQLFGQPFRWVEYDPSLPDALKTELDAMLQNMGSSGYARFPAGTKMEFIDSGKGSENSPQEGLMDRADRYARLLILGQTMSGGTDSSKGGGKAFGGVEADVKTRRVDAACEFIATILNTQLAPSILRVNYGDDQECPTCQFMEEFEGDLTDAQRDAALAAAGLEIPKSFLRKKYNIPAPTDDDEVIGQPAAAQATPPAPGRTEVKKEDEEKTAIEAAEAASEIVNRKSEIANALQETLLPVLKRLDAIARVDDAAIQQHMIQKLLKDFPAISEATTADTTLAKKLSPLLETNLLKGLQAKSAELQAGDLPGHEFRGNQWTAGVVGEGHIKLRDAKMTGESDKAIKVRLQTDEGSAEHWLPKSHASVDAQGDVHASDWIIREKESQMDEARRYDSERPVHRILTGDAPPPETAEQKTSREKANSEAWAKADKIAGDRAARSQARAAKTAAAKEAAKSPEQKAAEQKAHADRESAANHDYLRQKANLKANAEHPGKDNAEKRAARVSELLNAPDWVKFQLSKKP